MGQQEAEGCGAEGVCRDMKVPHPSASCWPNFHVSAKTFSSAPFSFLLAQLSCLCKHFQLRTLQLLVGPTFMSLQRHSAPHPSASCWPNFHVSANTFSSAPFSFLLAQLSCLCKHLQLRTLQLLVGPTFMSLQTPSAPHPSASCWPNFHVSANTFSSAPFSFLLAQLSCLCKHLQLRILQLLVGPTFMSLQTPSAPHLFSFLLAQLSCLCKHLQLRTLQLLVGPTFMSLQTPSAPQSFSFLLAQLSCLCKHLQLRTLQLLVGPTFMSLQTPSAPHPSASCWPNFHVDVVANTFSSAKNFTTFLLMPNFSCRHANTFSSCTLQQACWPFLELSCLFSNTFSSAPFSYLCCCPTFNVLHNTISAPHPSSLSKCDWQPRAKISCCLQTPISYTAAPSASMLAQTFMSLQTPSRRLHQAYSFLLAQLLHGDVVEIASVQFLWRLHDLLD